MSHRSRSGSEHENSEGIKHSSNRNGTLTLSPKNRPTLVRRPIQESHSSDINYNTFSSDSITKDLLMITKIPFWEVEKFTEKLRHYMRFYSLSSYAQKYFRALKTGSLFFKKNLPTRVLISACEDPIELSLHEGFNKTQNKDSIENFKNVLGYLEIGKKGIQNARISDLYAFGKKNEEYCRELYAQILKESVGLTPEVSLKAIHLLTALVSILVPPSEIDNIILSQFARLAFSDEEENSLAAQFGFIRLELILLTEKPLFENITSYIELKKDCDIIHSYKENFWCFIIRGFLESGISHRKSCS